MVSHTEEPGRMKMDTLRSASHLQRELGDELFQALISSDNTEAVRKFAKGLLKGALPTEIVVAGRTYEVLGFLREGEDYVTGRTMVERAKEMDANLGEDDGQHLLNNQQDIPTALRGKVVFVFTDWRHPDDSENVDYVYWYDDRWIRNGDWLGDGWGDCDRVLRRK